MLNKFLFELLLTFWSAYRGLKKAFVPKPKITVEKKTPIFISETINPWEIKTVDDLWNHIAYVLGSAPDSFPQEDFLSKNQQMNLEKAFDELRRGVNIAYPDDFFPEKKTILNEILDRSYSLYKAGKDIEAGHLLNEFEDNIFKKSPDSTLH